MDGRFRVYNFIARFIPESDRFFGLKRFLLRTCGCRVGKGARISSAVRFSGCGTVVIGSGCWICAGVIVTPGKSVGDRCVLGAGAVVTRDVPSGTLAAGVPATVRKRYLGTDEPPTRI